MEQGFLTTILIPASLVAIMFGMGLGLERSDFARLLEVPRSVVTGVLAQMILVPLAACLVVVLLPVRPVLAMGILIISFCPGGAVSNLVCHLARGNVALSVTLTAVSSMLTVFTIPLLVNWSMKWLMENSAEIHLPIGSTAMKLASVTMLPVVVGMVIRRRSPRFAARSQRAVRIASGVFLGVVIVAAVAPRAGQLPGYVREVGIQLVVLNAGVMTLGWLVAAAMSLDLRDRVTISIEAGIQNGALGIAIPATLIGNPEMAVPPAIYGVMMIVTSLGWVVWRAVDSTAGESGKVARR